MCTRLLSSLSGWPLQFETKIKSWLKNQLPLLTRRLPVVIISLSSPHFQGPLGLKTQIYCSLFVSKNLWNHNPTSLFDFTNQPHSKISFIFCFCHKTFSFYQGFVLTGQNTYKIRIYIQIVLLISNMFSNKKWHERKYVFKEDNGKQGERKIYNIEEGHDIKVSL